MTFHQNLTALRKRERWTQTELADRVGVSRSTIGMYERGVREPDHHTLKTLARVLGVDYNTLLGYPNISGKASSYIAVWTMFEDLDIIDQNKVIAYMDGLLAAEKYRR